MRSRDNFDPFPAWADAHLASKYIEKEKARGSRHAIWIREISQRWLGKFGRLAGRNSGVILFISCAVLALSCIGLQSVKLDTTLDKLWTPVSERLQRELSYVNGAVGNTPDTNELLIQTPKADLSILSTKALLEHLNVLQKALSVTVEMYDVTWGLKDLCYSPNIPTFDVQFIDNIFEKIFPCVIITPLDCFWEGSKLLGPEYPIQIPGFRGVKWTNLNPKDLLLKARLHQGLHGGGYTFEILEGFMKRAGIGSGYQEKPCLDPSDPDCPTTAPNKESNKSLDVASILAQGCYGFAPRFMHWPPDLIVGGQVYNKTGHLIRAGGLMSTVTLMSPMELVSFSQDSWKVKHIENWNDSKAQAIIRKWQSRFTTEVSHLSYDDGSENFGRIKIHSNPQNFNFHSFTPAGLDSVVEAASQFTWIWCGLRTGGVCGAILIVGVLFNGTMENLNLRLGLLIGGALIAILGTLAGCGIVAVLQFPYNVATVQVLPYLTLALVSPIIYLILYSQLNSGYDAKRTMKRHGFSLVLGIIVSGICIACGSFFPIPAVRYIAAEASIFMVISSLAMVVMFPALCQLVLKHRDLGIPSTQRNAHNNRITGGDNYFIGGYFPRNQFCSVNNNNSTTQSLHTPSVPLVPIRNQNNPSNATPIETDVEVETVEYAGGVGEGDRNLIGVNKVTCGQSNWVEKYVFLINKRWFRRVVFVFYIIWLAISAVGITRLRRGLPITNVVPYNTSEWKFLTAQSELFPIFNIKAVTKGNFDYPNNQKLIHSFHDTMSGLEWVVHDDNGGKPPMWLSVFRSWLLNLQDIFDVEWKLGFLHKESWTKNASADGILAWKLAVQTGHVDHPVDLTQLPNNRLVTSDGMINTKAFYVYLTAWAWNDPLAFGVTAANFQPYPREWVHFPEEKDLKIPKSLPIKFVEIPYVLRTSSDIDSSDFESDQEEQILSFVKEIRSICSQFELRGLPVFPWGIPFRFHEQYMELPTWSAMAIGAAVVSTLLILFLSLGFSWRVVGLVLFIIVITILQISGVMGWLKVGLNALPVEIVLLGISLILFSTIQVIIAFCCIPGPISTRYNVAFNLVGPPCVQSLLLTFGAALILYPPDFTFLYTNFTVLVALSALLSLVNFLLLLPLLLGIFRPVCWLEGTYSDDPAYLLPLTPSPTLKRASKTSINYCQTGNERYATVNGRNSRRNSSSGRRSAPPPYTSRPNSASSNRNCHKCSHGHHNNCSRAPSENSLSTITEEPNSCATRRSAEIVVQPQIVLGFDDGDCNTTRKVAAKLKVEVHSSTSHHNSNNTNNSTTTSSSNTYNSSSNASSNNPQSSVNISCNGSSENSATSSSTNSSGSFGTMSSSSSSNASFQELEKSIR